MKSTDSTLNLLAILWALSLRARTNALSRADYNTLWDLYSLISKDTQAGVDNEAFNQIREDRPKTWKFISGQADQVCKDSHSHYRELVRELSTWLQLLSDTEFRGRFGLKPSELVTTLGSATYARINHSRDPQPPEEEAKPPRKKIEGLERDVAFISSEVANIREKLTDLPALLSKHEEDRRHQDAERTEQIKIRVARAESYVAGTFNNGMKKYMGTLTDLAPKLIDQLKRARDSAAADEHHLTNFQYFLRYSSKFDKLVASCLSLVAAGLLTSFLIVLINKVAEADRTMGPTQAEVPMVYDEELDEPSEEEEKRLEQINELLMREDLPEDFRTSLRDVRKRMLLSP